MNTINDQYNSTTSITTITITSHQQQQQQQQQQSATIITKAQSITTINQEDDSGIEQDNVIFIRVCVNEQNLQKVLKFNLDDTVWIAKQKVLTNLARELRDGINYGFYMPPYQGRAGKFLDDCRLLREYPLSNGQLATLEFKYKKRVYKFIKLNPKEIKALNTKANLKRFLDYVRTNQTHRVSKYLEKGLDPNFHSDLGETPLTIAVSLLEPRDMIMNLYNGGAHLDFRSRDSLTPMHKAAQLGNDKALNILLELGGFADVRESKNLTPLFYAMINASSIKCVELLLYNGSVIGCKDDNNWQEIHYACKLGLSQHLDHLIYYGADLNSKNNSGNTPLHICAIHKQESCARILLFRGADKSIRNLSNQTAYESAMLTGNQSIAELIDKHKSNEIVPIKDKPQFNAKRRSVYLDGSNYGTMYSNSTAITHISANGSLTKSSVSTLNNPWNANLYANSASLRSRSMPKLENNNHTNTSNSTNTTITNANQINSTVKSNNINQINSGSSSPTSRSHSISSDDHGIGSASLSQLSGSPNIEYAYPRKRLYASIPDRKFICIKGYKPVQPGELELKKGDIIEILSVGEQGFWEGRSRSSEGWFPSDCVEEIQLPRDYNDSLVVKRKTLLNLITQSDYNTPRTVVLQRGKKGYGFVLRGAKVTDKKFEPTAEIPALQFLESVDIGSNADKAGLKSLDFVLEINGVDVTCRTHDECVKLIKKSGDTLALKVLTVNYISSKASPNNEQNTTHYASTTLATPSTPKTPIPTPTIINNRPPSPTISLQSKSSTQNQNKISISPTPTPIPPPPPQFSSPTPTTPSPTPFLAIPQDYNDGTKSLPHKNKPIPPKRHPNTSLTSIDSTCMTSFIYSNNSISKSSTNLSLYSTSNKIASTNDDENNNQNNPNNEQIQNKYYSSINLNSISSNALTSVSSSLLTTSSLSSPSSSTNTNFNIVNDEANNDNETATNENNNASSNTEISNYENNEQKPLAIMNNAKLLKKSLSINSDNTSYMNFVLAQIDELDKTLAEYETVNGNGNHNNNLNGKQNSNGNYNDSISSRNKNIANDANAASIRTRVPVRKPGINVNDNFTQMVSAGSAKLQQKTYSVPNLAQQQQQQINENNTAKITVNMEQQYQRQSSQVNGFKESDTISISSNASSIRQQQQQQQKSNLLIKTPSHSSQKAFNGGSLVNGTKHSASNDTLVQDDDYNHKKFIEPEIDYNDDVDNENENVNNKTVIPAPPPPPPLPPSQPMLSTFSSTTNLTNIKSSPLTPRQLKQRNSAKRSISRSNSSCTVNSNDSDTKNNNHLTKPSIPPPPPPPPPPLPTSDSIPQLSKANNRASSQPPITPTRVSTLLYVNDNSNNKPEDLNEAIRRAAAENMMKRQISNNSNSQDHNQASSTPPIIKSQTFTNGFNNQQNNSAVNNNKQIQPPLQFAVRNELERAIENRIKRANNLNVIEPSTPRNNSVLIQNGVVNKTSSFSKPIAAQSIYENNHVQSNEETINKRNLPRDPPPPLPVSAPPAVNRNNNTNKSVVELPPPPPPPPPAPPIISQNENNLPPPPSPTQLNRLNKIANVTPVIKTTSPANKPINQLPSPSTILPNQNGVVDPRTSSDFSAIIAKKAAEKRAKFHEVKPSAPSAVTFQADGSKVFTTNSNGTNGDVNHDDVNSNNNLLAASPQQNLSNGHSNETTVKPNNLKLNGINGANGNVMKKPTSNNNVVLKPVGTNNNAAQLVSSIQLNNLIDPTNIIYMNRNESFTNTASKLLEKVKQHQYTLTAIAAASTIAEQQSSSTNNLDVLPSKNNLNINNKIKNSENN